MSSWIRRLLRQQARAVAAGGDYDDVEIGPVPPGEQWYVERVALEDQTTAITKRGVAIRSAGAYYWLDEAVTTTAALRPGYQIRTFLNAGETLVCRFTGATENDVLYAYATGYYVEFQEP